MYGTSTLLCRTLAYVDIIHTHITYIHTQYKYTYLQNKYIHTYIWTCPLFIIQPFVLSRSVQTSPVHTESLKHVVYCRINVMMFAPQLLAPQLKLVWGFFKACRQNSYIYPITSAKRAVLKCTGIRLFTGVSKFIKVSRASFILYEISINL